jgi:polyferredoxin
MRLIRPIRPIGLMLTILALTLTASAFAEERFPPPDFSESSHQIPKLLDDLQRTPERRESFMPYVDLAMLVWTMALAAFFSLKLRSRPALLTLALICLGYFGFYRCGCICPIGAIQNVSFAAFSAKDYALPLVVAGFFLLPLLFALVFGRVFCAAVCPLGAIQDLVVLRPIKLPVWLREGLGLVPYIYLTLAVVVSALGAGFLICEYDPFVAIFRLDGSYNMLLLGGSLLVIALFIGRPYCRFLCPYGVLLSWLSPFARWKVKIHPENCVQCRLCEESCPFDAINVPTPESDPARRLEGKRGLIAALILIPVCLLIGSGLGCLSGPVLARLHFQVTLAEQVRAEDLEQATVTDESDAFRAHGGVPADLYKKAEQIRSQFRTGGALGGLFLGLVIGLKLTRLYLRRRRTGYEADAGACVSCARCYMTCPGEHARLGLVGEGVPK